MDNEVAMVLVTFIVLGIPILGLTARFALKPIVDSILRVREAFLEESRGLSVDPADVERLEAEVRELRQEVRRLTEAAEFDRKLLGSDE